MIPVLFDKDTTEFSRQGIGTLDCVSCLVTEERNGLYELVAKVRKESRHFEHIKEGNIIAATHSNKHDRQPFQIYKVTRTLDGFVEICAEHISYRLNKMTVMPFLALTPHYALQGLKNNAVDPCPFTFWTDLTGSGSYRVTKPAILKSCLSGSDGSVTDVYGGGEYEYDLFRVKLWRERGADNGVSLRFGKNLTELSKETDISDIYTSIVPYWIGVDENQTDVIVTLPENVVDSAYVNLFPTSRTVPVDLSSKFDDMPTIAELRAAATEYINENVRQQLFTTIKTQFIELGITDEYKDRVALESVDLCDIVTISYPEIGVKDKAQVTKVVYNTLLDRNESVELGELKKTLSQVFKRKPEITRQSVKQMITKEKIVREREIQTERETSERELRETKAELEQALQDAKDECDEKIRELEEAIENIAIAFPVGAVYLSVTSTNPGTYFPGTWVQISEGRYLKGVGTGSAEQTGGDLNGHAHDFSVMWKNFMEFRLSNDPSTTYLRYPTEAAIPGNYKSEIRGTEIIDFTSITLVDDNNIAQIEVDIRPGEAYNTTAVGETEPAVAEPPYFTVYVWKRIA